MLSDQVCIRGAKPDESSELLALMQALASFEGYRDEFTLSTAQLQARAFGPQPQCQIQVAEVAGRPRGYALSLIQPFTYDLRPTVVLKELYVDPAYRSLGLGQRLLRQVAAWALRQGAGRLHWDVLTGNSRAEQFYQRQGGQRVQKWLAYEMDSAALALLARIAPNA